MSRKRRLLKEMGCLECMACQFVDCDKEHAEQFLAGNPQLTHTICDGVRHNKNMTGNGSVGMEVPAAGLYFVAMDRAFVNKMMPDVAKNIQPPDLWDFLVIATAINSELAKRWKNLPGTQRQPMPFLHGQ